MATKKTPAQQFIAINENNESVICIGTLDEITDAIEEYCDFEDCDPSDVEDEVTVYELGPRVSFNVTTKVEVTF